jgi:uncharacterized protein
MKNLIAKVLPIVFTFFISYTLPVVAQDSYRSVKLGEIREVKSSVNGKEYELLINVPASYHTNMDRKYPVVYFCDGFYDFPLLVMIYNNLNYDQKVKECILVGFSYKGEISDYGPLRMHDYTPTKFDQNSGGGAKDFLAVVENDFIPFMEKNFRVDASWRALGGSSAGGLFSLYTLFTRPTLFNAYMAISPAVALDDRWLFKYEEAFSKKNNDLPVALYMTGAEKEFPHYPAFINSIIDFDKVLKKRNYANFRYGYRLLDDAYHASCKPEGYNRGMQFIFEPLLKQ